MDAKVEHLKLVQNVISRMAGNSFLLRGWSVALVAALFAFGSKGGDVAFVLVAWIPLLVFAGLDAYYLAHERRFRDLYKSITLRGDADVDFSMDVSNFIASRTWWHALRSRTVLGFYLPLAFFLSLLTVHFLAAKPDATPPQGVKTITITIQ